MAGGGESNNHKILHIAGDFGKIALMVAPLALLAA